MIDWITARVSCTHNPEVLNSGHVVALKPDGSVDWHTAKRLSVVGSYDSSITVRSHTHGVIEISGNPAKFLQGHNVFGTNDLQYLMAKFFDRLCMYEELELKPTYEEYEAVQEGKYHLTRVDVNEHFAFETEQLAKSWLRACGRTATMKYRGPAVFKGDTAYFSPTSRRIVSKIYHKADEISSTDKKHRLPEKLLQIPELMEYARRSLRFEIKLFSTQLKDWYLHLGCNWSPEVATMLIKEQFLDKLELSANMALDSEVLNSLPKNLRLTYAAWASGEDLRTVLSRPTFYRYKEKFKEYGIDISIVQDDQNKLSNVIPMIRYVEAAPMGIPDWAYQKGLVA